MMSEKNKPKKAVKPKAPIRNKEIDAVIKSALTEYLHEQNANKRYNKKTILALMSVVQEFLNSFIILGYNTNHEPVEIISFHNQQEAGALTVLINKFFDRTNGDVEDATE